MRARILPVAFLALFCLGSMCEKVPLRGWERTQFEPTSTNKPYSLPSALEVRTIVGLYEEDTMVSLLPLAFTVFNTTGARAGATLPAGLIFTPTNLDYQYMITLQPFSVSVPPDQDTTVVLPTFCCNEMLDEPDDEAYYGIENIEWEVEMNELIHLLKDKNLTGYATLDLVQEALFEITDGNGLTDSMKVKLDSLP